MNKWSKSRLGDISEMCLGKMLDKEKNKGELQAYLANLNVRWGSFDFVNLNKMRFENSESERYGLKYGDLVICEGGEPGRCAIWKGEIPEMKIQKALHRVRINNNFSNQFVYYRFLLAGRTGELKNHFIGSTIKHLTGVGLKQIEFAFPSLNDQQKIAAVLSALDSKIELNNRINTELEAMAKTLYDYWFVQFDFPDKDGKPYKTSGGKMVWNEELKRDIPDGWEDGILGDILSLEYGKPLKNEDRSGNGYPVLGSNGVVGYHNEYLVEGPGIAVGRKGTAGAVVWVEDNFYPIDTSFYVKDKLNVNSLFLHYFLLLRSNFKDVESGSAVPGLNRNFVYSVKIDIPEKFFIQHFNKIVEPYFSKIRVCNKENKTLSELRDWLLPMLMNGQVKVN